MKILLVSTAWPWPTRKGYQLRLLQLAGSADTASLRAAEPVARDAVKPPLEETI